MASLIIVIICIMTTLSHMDEFYNFYRAVVTALGGSVLGLLLIIAVFELAVILLKKRQDAERRPKTQN